MSSIFSNNTVELKHKKTTYTVPEHIFLKVSSEPTAQNPIEYRGTFGLYTIKKNSFLDGAYSIVVKYEDQTVKNKEYSRIALKVSSHTKSNYYKIKQELDIYKILREKSKYDKYICACYGIETLKYGRKMFNYLTMEYLTCDLFDFIFKHRRIYTDKNAYSILLQALYGLKFLHQNNIIYNDLKMENIMISNIKCNSETGENKIQVKLIDFNCSTILNCKNETGGGTLEYMSPELQQCVNRCSFKKLTPKSDIWTMGILSCLLFLHAHPYEDKKSKQIIKNIQINKYNDIELCKIYIYSLKDNESIPPFIRENYKNEETLLYIMGGCLKTSLDERISSDELESILSEC